MRRSVKFESFPNHKVVVHYPLESGFGDAMNVKVAEAVTSDAAHLQLPKSSDPHPIVLVQLPAVIKMNLYTTCAMYKKKEGRFYVFCTFFQFLANH